MASEEETSNILSLQKTKANGHVCVSFCFAGPRRGLLTMGRTSRNHLETDGYMADTAEPGVTSSVLNPFPLSDDLSNPVTKSLQRAWFFPSMLPCAVFL